MLQCWESEGKEYLKTNTSKAISKVLGIIQLKFFFSRKHLILKASLMSS